MKTIRIVHVDGKLPNLALMALSAWFKSQGHAVHFTREVSRQFGEPDYDEVYASAIFSKSAPLVDELRRWWPDAIVGGTWTDLRGPDGEDLNPKVSGIVPPGFPHLDYEIYPEFTASLGFSQRGCRFRCSFCRVPGLEGRPNSFSPIHSIWRGPGHPKHLHLLDNDFFASPEWPDRIAEIREGGFRVCFSQGLNIRIISHAQAAALATVMYRDNLFKRSRLYTAWDNLGDERVFFRGVDRLEEHGIPPRHLMAYSLVGFFPDETWEGIWHRHQRMVDRGIRPYVMIHEDAKLREPGGAASAWSQLKALQRWTNMGIYRFLPDFSEYRVSHKTARHGKGALDTAQLELL